MYSSNKAHDGDYDTHYSPKDGAMAGNYLKLYLTGVAGIGEVKMISRRDNMFINRMPNTEVRVYCCNTTEMIQVSSCGKLIGTVRISCPLDCRPCCSR